MGRTCNLLQSVKLIWIFLPKLQGVSYRRGKVILGRANADDQACSKEYNLNPVVKQLDYNEHYGSEGNNIIVVIYY